MIEKRIEMDDFAAPLVYIPEQWPWSIYRNISMPYAVAATVSDKTIGYTEEGKPVVKRPQRKGNGHLKVVLMKGGWRYPRKIVYPAAKMYYIYNVGRGDNPPASKLVRGTMDTTYLLSAEFNIRSNGTPIEAQRAWYNVWHAKTTRQDSPLNFDYSRVPSKHSIHDNIVSDRNWFGYPKYNGYYQPGIVKDTPGFNGVGAKHSARCWMMEIIYPVSRKFGEGVIANENGDIWKIPVYAFGVKAKRVDRDFDGAFDGYFTPEGIWVDHQVSSDIPTERYNRIDEILNNAWYGSVTHNTPTRYSFRKGYTSACDDIPDKLVNHIGTLHQAMVEHEVRERPHMGSPQTRRTIIETTEGLVRCNPPKGAKAGQVQKFTYTVQKPWKENANPAKNDYWNGSKADYQVCEEDDRVKPDENGLLWYRPGIDGEWDVNVRTGYAEFAHNPRRGRFVRVLHGKDLKTGKKCSLEPLCPGEGLPKEVLKARRDADKAAGIIYTEKAVGQMCKYISKTDTMSFQGRTHNGEPHQMTWEAKPWESGTKRFDYDNRNATTSYSVEPNPGERAPAGFWNGLFSGMSGAHGI